VKDDNQNKAENFWPTLVEFLFATRSWWAGVCAEFDLTPAQGQALKVLDPARPVPMSTLAEALFCDASNVTGIVDRLEKRGLVERRSAEGDRRVKALTLTPAGVELREEVMALMSEPPEAIASLSVADQRVLRDILARAVENL